MLMHMIPKQIDENEIFILITLLVGYALVWLLPKRFSSTVKIMIIIFCFFVAITFDEVLAAPPNDLYDMNDSPKSDFVDFIMWLMYGPFGYLFVYLYDRWRIRGISIVLYVVVWSLFSVGFEWLASLVHIFNYNSWMLVYSFPIYLFVDVLTLMYFHFIQNYFQKTKKSPQ